MRRPTKRLLGNSKTRSRTTFDHNQIRLSFDLFDTATKFYKRPPSYTTRAMWKKYPTPFVFENPVPEGDAVIVRKFYPAKVVDGPEVA